MAASTLSRTSKFSSGDTGASRTESNQGLISCIAGKGGRIRVDCYGNDIVIREPNEQKSKKNKVPQKITFRDQISLVDADPDYEQQILSEVIMVESYKRYNAETKPNDEGCCTIF